MSNDTSVSDAATILPTLDTHEIPIAGHGWAIFSEVLMVLGWTVAADLLIFRVRGYFAIAVFFAIAMLALFIVHQLRDELFQESQRPTSSGRRNRRGAVWIAGSLLVLAILRIGWSGSVPASLAAAYVFISLVLSLSGWLPTLSRVLTTILFAPFFGAERLPQLQRVSTPEGIVPSRSVWLSVLFPLVAVGLFGSIFILANPDLVERVSGWIGRFSDKIFGFFSEISFWELPFVVLAFFVGCGVLRPFVPAHNDLLLRLLGPGIAADSSPSKASPDETANPLYAPFRNTLIALIALFAAYLVFEFRTLWQREFPEGFYYAGYAHEGAAWLTIALALATLTLSIVFNHAMFRDPRVGRLKTLAWIWSAMNLLLAIAVYNRLSIYVGYNGMTRMRLVGFFGITLVLVGFVLVIRKILRQRSFQWLVQSQLIALSLAVVLYCLFPVDYIAHRYNAARVADGYLKPSVMIAVKPIDDEGVFPILDLVDHSDVIIREGVRAMLAERQRQIESYSQDTPWHWHRYQYSKARLYRLLDQNKSKWSDYVNDPEARQQATTKFEDYAMQWY